MTNINARDKQRIEDRPYLKTNAVASLHDLHNAQQASYQSGSAYHGHVKSAHKGIEDSNCRACKELRIKCNI